MARVLLVEDSPTQAIEMRMLLEAGSHTVHHVGNGKVALEYLESHPIELVVTDLDMPEMNGLDLVRNMQLNFEHIPAVLVTAKGSEELASRALQQGAAGYVPKNHLSTLLNDTIVDVLGVFRTDTSFSKLISTLTENTFKFDMPNDASLISPLIGLLMQVASGMEVASGTELVRLGTAVEHAIVNAMFRGNLELGPSVTPSHRAIVYDDATSDLIERRKVSEPYAGRRVYVEATATKTHIRFLVRDDGNGFDIAKVPRRDECQKLDTESGRGLVLMQCFTDELNFNITGNEVEMIKRFGAVKPQNGKS
ncbi:response regulator [Rubripirellula amarantea]|uniref:Chemotaxis protein CheY n=1 Tax=Rubripirellula amarantea TaxID=2527999 RepID=A0A5C5WW35_9BACT|nr:response regulator [Rubripirellula amarantea]MDA8746321.1 response regulator [Rubripirellula amarantea]TWT55164.1 Chemotaxis protein CheY [Rubripirellula amarantea]